MSEITRAFEEVARGGPNADEKLLALVYAELRRLADARIRHERPGQTLSATDLVHEAYLRLLGTDNCIGNWNSRSHFFAAAASAMRQILINRARDKQRLKRGGKAKRLQLDQIDIALDTPADELLALHEALEELEKEDPQSAALVNLRFFAGLTMGQAAASLGLAPRTADRLWAYARAWLFSYLRNN